MSLIIGQIKSETLELIEKQAEIFGLSVDDYLRSLLPKDENNLALKDEQTFESDMLEFAENTENYQGSYSREDIYFDHD
jgi:hypothetical protein